MVPCKQEYFKILIFFAPFISYYLSLSTFFKPKMARQISFGLFSGHIAIPQKCFKSLWETAQKLSFSLRISLINMTKSAVSLIESLIENFIFCAVLQRYMQNIVKYRICNFLRKKLTVKSC